MPIYSKLRFRLAVVLGLASFALIADAKPPKAAGVSASMQQAAVSFLDTLNGPLREQATFAFDSPVRTNWHFVPKERDGVSFREMNLQQRRAARRLMRSVLSEKGYFKSLTIMSLELVLRELEATRENVESIRNPENYWFAVFGDPESEKPWGWRVEGHHLSLNFSSVDGVVAGSTPIFLGASPAEVRVGARLGLRVLGDEEDRARALMGTFTSAQRKQAIVAQAAPRDVLTVPGQPIEIGEPVGVRAGDMTPSQRARLWAMVTSFLNHLRPALAEKEIREVEQAGADDIHFAWAGGLGPEENHYFRLHGPTFLLEYDNAQGNHAHVVWHSRGNNFGAAVLRRHYRESPHHQGAQE